MAALDFLFFWARWGNFSFTAVTQVGPGIVPCHAENCPAFRFDLGLNNKLLRKRPGFCWDFWWELMSSGGIWWVFIGFGEFWWDLVSSGGIWWVFIGFGESWWVSVGFGGFRWVFSGFFLARKWKVHFCTCYTRMGSCFFGELWMWNVNTLWVSLFVRWLIVDLCWHGWIKIPWGCQGQPKHPAKREEVSWSLHATFKLGSDSEGIVNCGNGGGRKL